MKNHDSLQTNISEVFSSIQGEGLMVGCRQIFIRFSKCNLSCNYCDTRVNEESQFCVFEKIPGEGKTKLIPNPISIEQLKNQIYTYYPSYHHSISITGGEPLLNSDFLKELIPEINYTRNGIYLETNGTLPEELEKVIDYINIISMDIKIPSSAIIKPMWDLHRSFLKIAASKETFVKIIVCEKTSLHEIDMVLDIILSVSKLPLVLQPVTSINQPKKNTPVVPITPQKALKLQEHALKYIDDVRIIPQTHKMINFM